jgi:hypothetical protein
MTMFEYLKRVVLLVKITRKSSLSFSSLCTLRDTQHFLLILWLRLSQSAELDRSGVKKLTVNLF